jgi:hypothetical protein
MFLLSLVQQNCPLFANFDGLLVLLVLRFDIAVSLPGSLDWERIVKPVDLVWNTATAQGMNLCLLLLSQVKFPFNIERIIGQTSHSNVFWCFGTQLSLASPESLLLHTSQLSSVLVLHLVKAHSASAMRSLLRDAPIFSRQICLCSRIPLARTWTRRRAIPSWRCSLRSSSQPMPSSASSRTRHIQAK